jgi:hypothetical protein
VSRLDLHFSRLDSSAARETAWDAGQRAIGGMGRGLGLSTNPYKCLSEVCMRGGGWAARQRPTRAGGEGELRVTLRHLLQA